MTTVQVLDEVFEKYDPDLKGRLYDKEGKEQIDSDKSGDTLALFVLREISYFLEYHSNEGEQRSDLNSDSVYAAANALTAASGQLSVVADGLMSIAERMFREGK